MTSGSVVDATAVAALGVMAILPKITVGSCVDATADAAAGVTDSPPNALRMA
jgi:hypothetical protein